MPATRLSAGADDQAATYWRAAADAMRHGDLRQAVAAFEAGLACAPGHVPMLLGLSEALERQGGRRRPRQLLLEAQARAEDSAPLVFGIAQGLFRFNEYAELNALLARPVFVDGAPPRVLADAAAMLATIGATEQAMALVERALQLDPVHPQALYFRGNLRTFHGDLAGARDDYRAALASQPRMFQAWWMLSGLRPATADDNRIPELLRQLQHAAPGGHGEQFLHYALHKEAHDLGDHALAWRSLERACEIGKRGSRFDRAAFARLVERMASAFDERVLARRAAPVGGSTPIFIVGMYRSGTSLLERMLAGHPDVADGGETHAFPEQVRLAVDRSYHGVFDGVVLDRLDDLDLDAIAQGYASSATWLSRGRRMFTEKLPSNFLNVGLIATALPAARIIHVRRDPVDTCFANLATLFAPAVDHVHDQLDVAGYHHGCVRLMEHWKALLPGRILTIDYGDLVDDPAGQAQRVARFCGLDYSPSMIDVARTGGRIVTASAVQVRGGILRGRTGAWKPYAGHLAPMMRALGVAPASPPDDAAGPQGMQER